MKKEPQEYYTPIQLKLQVDFEKIIEFEDPVYKFNEVMNHIDLKARYNHIEQFIFTLNTQKSNECQSYSIKWADILGHSVFYDYFVLYRVSALLSY